MFGMNLNNNKKRLFPYEMFNSFLQTKLMHCISEKKIIILFLFIIFSCEEGVLDIRPWDILFSYFWLVFYFQKALSGPRTETQVLHLLRKRTSHSTRQLVSFALLLYACFLKNFMEQYKATGEGR